jgi:putative ABC transport system permease protein
VLYDTTPLVSARVRSSGMEYSESAARALFDQVLAVALQLPNVDSAAIADAIPGAATAGPRYGMSGLVADDPSRVASGLPRRYDVYSIHASPNFLRTTGIALRRGRDLIPADAEGAMVALISESAADALWPGQDPLGKHLKCCGYRAPLTVVGVFADPVDSADRSPQTRLSNFVILPIFQMAGIDPVVLVRSKIPVGQIDALRGAIGNVDPDAPVFEVSTVDDILLNGVAGQRAVRWLFTTLGALALLISVLGIYGVVTYFVSQRTREFGVRLALGATPRAVVKMVLDYTIHVMLVGLLPAVFVAAVSTRLLEHNLMNLMPNSIAAWVQTPIAMLVAGIVAGLVPARRAARVDPNVALREL